MPLGLDPLGGLGTDRLLDPPSSREPDEPDPDKLYEERRERGEKAKPRPRKKTTPAVRAEAAVCRTKRWLDELHFHPEDSDEPLNWTRRQVALAEAWLAREETKR